MYENLNHTEGGIVFVRKETPNTLSYPLQDEWEVYLPGGGVEWVHLWGDITALTGPAQVVVTTPLGYPPVFYRKGSEYESLFQEIADEFGSEGKLEIRH